MRTFATGCSKRRGVTPTAVAALVVCLQLGGCATTDAPGPGGHPASSPTTAASVLEPALRCMDGLLLDHGVSDLSLILAAGSDADRQAQAQVGSHLAATFSDMTRHSRAIRLVTPGGDLQREAGIAGAAAAPAPGRQFALRANFASNVGVTSQGQSLGLELSLLNLGDLSVVPGSGRYNEISLRAGPAAFTKFGQAFGVAAATTPASATRALVEVASIELVGRLVRLPYWTCFGLDDGNQAVAAEIQDWYDGLAARPEELVGYFQQALRQRRLYGGPVDGNPDAEFIEAVARTRESLGQPREPKLSLDFFRAWLNADQASLLAAAPPPAPAAFNGAGGGTVDATASAPVASPLSAAVAPPLVTPIPTAVVTPAPLGGAQPLRLKVSADGNARRFARGQPVNLSIRPNREANIYCFLHDDQGQIVRFFPNRFQRDSRVGPDAVLRLPGNHQFRLVMNAQGVTETVACFATDRDVLVDLPSDLGQTDLVPLQARSLDEVRAAFIDVAGGVLGQQTFELRAR